MIRRPLLLPSPFRLRASISASAPCTSVGGVSDWDTVNESRVGGAVVPSTCVSIGLSACAPNSLCHLCVCVCGEGAMDAQAVHSAHTRAIRRPHIRRIDRGGGGGNLIRVTVDVHLDTTSPTADATRRNAANGRTAPPQVRLHSILHAIRPSGLIIDYSYRC